jgi:hypothetical protein
VKATSTESKGPSVVDVVLCCTIVETAACWALAMTWSWFMVPLGLSPIGVIHALGIRVVWDCIGAVANDSPTPTRDEFIATAMFKVTMYGLLTSIGLVAQSLTEAA